MKKIIASAGLVAIGAVTLNAQYAPGLSRMEASKPWSVSASLRGFYDDNYNTAPEHPSNPAIPSAKDSFGIEVSPSIALNFPMETTYARLGFIYSMRYYENRPENNVDHSFEGTGKVEHQFSDRIKASVDDSLVYAQEPEVAEGNGTITAPIVRQRHDASVLRNRGAIEVDGKITEQASFAAAYNNSWYKYEDKVINAPLLDRLDHRFLIDGRWKLQENLLALLGYNYRILDYTSDESLVASGAPGIKGSDRSSTSHYFYGGLMRQLSSQLNGTIKVGAEYTSYDLGDQSTWSPYAEASANYTYLPGSSVEVGIRHDRNATDVVGATAANPQDVTVDAEYTSLYAQLTHKISPALTGSLLGQYQLADFRGGLYNNKSDNLFLIGVNLEYKFTEHWSSELGYNFDKLDSDVADRDFTRNRVYIGVRASY